MPTSVDLNKDLALEVLEIAAAQRSRAAQKFKPGTPARQALDQEAAAIELAYNKLKSEPTPLETAIDKTKNK